MAFFNRLAVSIKSRWLMEQRWTRDGTRRRDFGALSSAVYGHDSARSAYSVSGTPWTNWYSGYDGSSKTPRTRHMGTPLTCASLECRTRGGTASLCGFSEYTSASTPPKKYRLKTWSGQTQDMIGGSCAINGDLEQYSGTVVYSATTCGTTNTLVYTLNGAANPFGQPAITDVPACFACGSPPSYGCTTTATVTARTSGTVCADCGAGGHHQGIGNPAATLSTEDTEADAITRLLAGAGGTWSAWAASSSTTCLARRQARTTGFDLVYQESEWRRVFTGLVAGETYYIEVKLNRSVYGAASYSLFQTVRVYGTADGTGNLTLTGTVTNTSGYETYALC